MSLRREAGSAKLLRETRRDDTPAKGSVDQEAVIEDAPGYINEHEKRFILLPGSGIPTPPTSDEEKRRKARRRLSQLDTKFHEKVPELEKRIASPYSFKPTRLSKDSSSPSNRILSSDVPSARDPVGGHPRLGSASGAPTPRRDPERSSPTSYRKGKDYLPRTKRNDEDSAIDDGTYDPRYAASESSRKDSFRQSSRPRPSNITSQPSAVDFAKASTNAPPHRRTTLDARRNTDTADNRPALSRPIVDKTRRPSPLVSAFALGGLAGVASQRSPEIPSAQDALHPPRREGSRVSSISSRAASPVSNSVRREQSPPRQPSRGSTRSSNASAPSSKAGSANGSRPASPALKMPGDSPRLPKTDMDWSTLLAANAARRGKPPSRLSSSMRQESMPEVPRSAFVMPDSSSYDRPPLSGVLPYPEDDGLMGTPTSYMPSEREYQYFGPSSAGLSAPFSNDLRASISREPSPGKASTARPPRPTLSQRHSGMHVPPVDERQSIPNARQPAMSSSQVRKPLAELMKIDLDECPRPDPVAGKSDWYTIIGAPDTAICPTCLDVFEQTAFRSEIRLAPPRDLSKKVQCTIGASKWMQLAWKLTIRLQRTDLALLKDMVDIDQTSEPCPGQEEATRSWYGLRDSDGMFVRDFYVCYSDVRKLERLLPTLSGMFIRMPPGRAPDRCRCAMGDTESNRFAAYLEELLATHDRALSSHKGANANSLTEMIKRKMRLQECERDRMLRGGLWHFMPDLPALTVCEDCFEHVVEPEIRKGSEIAARFHRTVQPVYNEGVGSSCQLYSLYMRQVFQRAVRRRDFHHLAGRAQERRDAEVRLHGRWRDVDRRAQQRSRDSSSEDETAQLQREVDQIKYEWRSQWE